jgi:hypothetical protein
LRPFLVFIALLAFYSSSLEASIIRKTVSVDEAFVEAVNLRKIGRQEESDLIFNSITDAKTDPIILLEIARIYHQEKRFKEANHLFRLVKQSFDLPLITIEKINFFISQAEKTDTVLTYEWAISKTRNPNRNARTGEYIIFGIPLNYLNPEARSYLGINHRIKLGKRFENGWDGMISLEARDFENKEADQNITSIRLDNSRILSPFYAGLNVTNQSGNLFKESAVGPFIGFEGVISKLNINSELDFSMVDNSNTEGSQIAFSNSIYNPLGLHNSRLSWSYRDQNFKNKLYSNQYASIQLTKKVVFEDFTIRPSILFSKTVFNLVDPLWAKRRMDNTVSPSLELCFKTRVILEGYSSCILITKEERMSNISFYEFKETSVTISVSKLF